MRVRIRRPVGLIITIAASLMMAGLFIGGGVRSDTAVTPIAAFVQPTSDPTALRQVALMQRQVSALNAGDVDAVMALFTDRPIYEGLGQCRPTACVGADAVRREIERQVRSAIQITITEVQGTPPLVTGQAEMTGDDVRAAGLTRIVLRLTAEIVNERIASVQWEPVWDDPQTAAFFASESAATVATLDLSDPRPCIPPSGERACDAERAALWTGDAAAWARRSVTNPDARFNETVVFRVRAGDPAAIRTIAQLLDAPYLKVTRVQFAGTDEVVEVTNLGGGAQDLTGWTLRSPARDAVFRLPAGVILAPGEICRLISGPPTTNPGGACRTFTSVALVEAGGDLSDARTLTDVWPDDHGRVVLFYDALDLPGDDTRYSADPANQPPPPNLQLVR